MRDLWCAWVLEVGEGEVEEVDDLQEEAPPEMRTDPEVDEAHLQQVVVGECRSEVGADDGRLGFEERGEVGDLEDVEDDPG